MNYCPKCGLPKFDPNWYTWTDGVSAIIPCRCEGTITTNSTAMSQQYYIFTDGKDVFVTDKIEPPLSSNSEDARKEFLSKSVRVENVDIGTNSKYFRWSDGVNCKTFGDEPAAVNHLYPLEADRWRVEYGHYAVLGEKTDLGYKLTGSERTATILPVSQPTEVTGEVSEDEMWDDVWTTIDKADYATNPIIELKSKYTITPKGVGKQNCIPSNAVDKRLRTIKRLTSEVGMSSRYITKLMRQGRLTRYKVGRSTYVSLTEFEEIAKPVHA
jgi:hypothetical protein